MRTLCGFFVVIALALLAGAAVGQDNAEIESAIDALAAKYMEGWKAGDAAACAAIYTDDGESIDLMGQTFKGRSAIQESIAATLEQYSESSIQIERTTLHVVTENLVVSDGNWEVTGSSAEGIPTKGFYTIIATNEGGEWLVTSGQAKVPPPMPNQ